MSFSEIAEAIGENVENAGGGLIQLGGETLTVRAAGRVKTVEEIERLPLKFGSRATPLRVKDVADVGIGKAVRTGTATYKGEEAVLGSALMLAGENSRIVAKRVDEKLKEVQTKLPAGVEIIRSMTARCWWTAPSARWKRVCSRARFSSWSCCWSCSATGARRSSWRWPSRSRCCLP
jgi:Cu/Ag efflux pump CusA